MASPRSIYRCPLCGGRANVLNIQHLADGQPQRRLVCTAPLCAHRFTNRAPARAYQRKPRQAPPGVPQRTAWRPYPFNLQHQPPPP